MRCGGEDERSAFEAIYHMRASVFFFFFAPFSRAVLGGAARPPPPAPSLFYFFISVNCIFEKLLNASIPIGMYVGVSLWSNAFFCYRIRTSSIKAAYKYTFYYYVPIRCFFTLLSICFNIKTTFDCYRMHRLRIAKSMITRKTLKV